ncbi:MAG: T9SS type A sorting domain-containing protein [Chitinophagia bacterium]|jgi:hypothetical protein
MKPLLTIALIFLSSLVMGQTKRVAVGDNTPKVVNIYPNPARSFVRIQYRYSTPPPSALIIFNFAGKKQFEMNQPGNNVYIDLAEFRRGIYVFQFRDRNGQIIDSGKFQVEK